MAQIESGSTYLAEARREKSKKRIREQAFRLNNCGPLPEVVDSDRRSKCSESLKLFCETYFKEIFYLGWSEAHLDLIGAVQEGILHGGQLAFAIWRGGGKTSLCESAVIWALLNGHSQFALLIGASEEAAEQRLRSIKTTFETNDALYQDYPEVCHPVRRLERAYRRTEVQHLDGNPTAMDWTASRLVLPTIEGSKSSGSIIRVAGIKAEIRGMSHKLRDGKVIRPDLAIADDPQTRESAGSPAQSRRREETLAGDVAYLAGPGRPITVIMPCTVIYRDDLADRMLDREAHPEWRGRRVKLIRKFPKNEKLWVKYEQIYKDSLRNDGKGIEARDFYAKNRDKMDDGAEASWPERFNSPLEISAIQHAINLKLRDESAFYSECQNEPIEDAESAAEACKPVEIQSKRNHLARGVCPESATKVTAFVDVQKKCFYWVVMAWEVGFTGYVLDYGIFPAVKRRNYSLSSVKHTLQAAFKTDDMAQCCFFGLDSFIPEMLGYEFEIQKIGGARQIDTLLVDAGWGKVTESIYSWCRHGDRRNVMPSHGVYVGASNKPWSEYKRRPGETLGHHWRIPPIDRTRITSHVIYDTNYWKSFVHEHFKMTLGQTGGLSVFGKNGSRRISADFHLEFAQQVCAEYPVSVEHKGKKTLEWKTKAHIRDNHFLDCVVGCSVAASISGIESTAITSRKTHGRERRRIGYGDEAA